MGSIGSVIVKYPRCCRHFPVSAAIAWEQPVANCFLLLPTRTSICSLPIPFEKMSTESKVTQFGETSARVPSIEHVIALKLHALKQGLAHRRILDFDDVMNLVLKNGIDLGESRWREIFEKHGNLDLYERLRKATH